MDHGEPPDAQSEELPITPDQPVSDAEHTTSTRAARIGIVATLPHSPTLREYIDRAIHDELWVPEGTGGTRISLSTHSTSVIRTKGNTRVQLLITLTPRPEHRERVIQTIHGLVSRYARSVDGVVHELVEDEVRLRQVATGKAAEV